MSSFDLPPVAVSKDLFERIQFSLSSRNAENKIAECAVHIFASKSVENLHDIDWQYVASGVPCILRNREVHKSGRKYVWSMSLCLYDAHYGVLVWKAKLLPNSDYTAVADNFHVFALSEVNVTIGLMFTSKEQACELFTTCNRWHQERQRDDGKKGSSASKGESQAIRFKKEMISKPCNFQHIQGTQALDECLEIEKIKADIIAAFFGLGTTAGRSETDGEAAKRKGANSKRGKREITKPKMLFKMISVPRTSFNSPPVSPSLSPPASAVLPQEVPVAQSTAQPLSYQNSVDVANGYQDNSNVFVPPAPPAQATGDVYVPQVTIEHDSPMDTGYVEQSEVVHETQPATIYDQLQSAANDQLNPPTTSDYDQLEPSNGETSDQPSRDDPFEQLQPPGTYFTASQGSYGFNNSPPRLDLNLEKEFSESVLFQSTLMTAN